MLRERFKESKILVLHAENFENRPLENAHTLTSLDTEEIYKFLEIHIQNTNADRIRVIEWRPSLNYFKDAYVKILSTVAAFLKRADAEKRTTTVFGKRWIKNFFKNIGNINHTLLYRQMEIPRNYYGLRSKP